MTTQGDYVMPANLEAERVVLGSILLDNEIYYQAAESIRPDYFAVGSHRCIYGAMLELDADAKPIDIMTVADRLLARKELEAVGGREYLFRLTEGLPQRRNIRHYVNLVREKAQLRAIIHACNAAAARAAEPDAVAAQCASGLEDYLLSLQSQEASGTVQLVDQFAQQTYENLLKMSASEREVIGLSTGIATIDVMTTGIRKHQLWMVGGRTGEGKSCIAAQVIVANASKGIPVLLFTPEMSREQVIERLSVQVSGVPAWKFTKPRSMTQKDLATVHDTISAISKWPLYVDDSGSISAQEVAARARIYAKQNGVQLIIVDYVQLIEARGHDERERVSTVSRYLRVVAKDVAPVLALSQMPRPKDDLNRWPTKYDLKESGSLENDSSTILMIFRTVDRQTSLPTGEDFIVVPKQRHGPIGFEPVTFDEDRLIYRPRTSERGDGVDTAAGRAG